jgi:hypothetical protein
MKKEVVDEYDEDEAEDDGVALVDTTSFADVSTISCRGCAHFCNDFKFLIVSCQLFEFANNV